MAWPGVLTAPPEAPPRSAVRDRPGLDVAREGGTRREPEPVVDPVEGGCPPFLGLITSLSPRGTVRYLPRVTPMATTVRTGM